MSRMGRKPMLPEKRRVARSIRIAPETDKILGSMRLPWESFSKVIDRVVRNKTMELEVRSFSTMEEALEFMERFIQMFEHDEERKSGPSRDNYDDQSYTFVLPDYYCTLIASNAGPGTIVVYFQTTPRSR